MANKKRRCRNCKAYSPVDDGLVVNGGYYCNYDCATEYAIKNQHKGKRIKQREQKKEFILNDISHQHKLTQTVFNKMRVLEELEWFKSKNLEAECISCGGKNKDWCCGHYKSRGAQGNLRYDDKNTFLQCNRYCNMALSGNISGNKNTRGYTQGLIDRFGKDKGEEIIKYCEVNTEPRKFTGEELMKMRKEFNSKIKSLQQL